jgi:hypothetical protein
MLIAVIPPATLAADLEVEQLRRDVRALEQTVTSQARRIDELERALNRLGAASAPSASTSRTPPNDAADRPPWLAADRWQALAIGMPAQDVLEVLGQPTAVRIGSTPDERVLLYTLELDDNAFLSGQVRIRDDRVTAVERPTLR